MKKLAAIAIALIFVVAPVMVSCTKEEPDKKVEKEKVVKVRKDTLAPGWSWIPYEPIPF